MERIGKALVDQTSEIGYKPGLVIVEEV